MIAAWNKCWKLRVVWDRQRFILPRDNYRDDHSGDIRLHYYFRFKVKVHCVIELNYKRHELNNYRKINSKKITYILLADFEESV